MSEPAWEPLGPVIGPAGPAGVAGTAGAQGPQGPAGPAGATLPTPVEGQWLKGQGGAAIWAVIPEFTNAGRYGGNEETRFPPNSDWNQVTETGFYMSANCANQPAPSDQWWIGFCLVHNSAWQQQTVWGFEYNPAPRRRRGMYNGTWYGWSGW